MTQAVCCALHRKLLPFKFCKPTLTKLSDDAPETIARLSCEYTPLHTFDLEKEKHYQQQYGDMYFLRLVKLKPAAEKNAAEAWTGFQVGGEEVRKVERVLDVRQGELCWVTGTIYMDMPLKPNILDDISKDVRWDILKMVEKSKADEDVALGHSRAAEGEVHFA